LLGGADNRHGIRSDVDQAGPFVADAGVGKPGESPAQMLQRFAVESGLWLRVEYADLLERRGLVGVPAPWHAPFVDELLADPQPEFAPAFDQGRRKVGQQPEAVGGDGGDIGVATGDRITAVQARTGG